jgi:hypothetical protein
MKTLSSGGFIWTMVDVAKAAVWNLAKGERADA